MTRKLLTKDGKPLFPETGDLVGFSGANWVSALITLGTYGLPFVGVSHVGVVAPYEGEHCLFESTTLADMPCMETGITKGMKVVDLGERIAKYNGRVYYYKVGRPVYRLQEEAMVEFLRAQLGKGYDPIGAFRSGGKLLALVESLLREEDLSDLFCSEVTAAALREGELLDTDNASGWNPHTLLDHQVKTEMAQQPLRMK